MADLTSTTETILKKLLEEISDRENLRKCDIEIKPLPSTGSNYTADLLLATITDEQNEKLELFAKVANLNEIARTFMPAEDMYKRERFVYKDLTKIYDDLQDKHNIPEQDKFKFPKHYGSISTRMEETLVIENLSVQGYDVPDRFTSMEWAYAKKSVEELAKFHALSLAFESEQPNEHKNAISGQEDYLFTYEKLSEEDAKIYLNGLANSVLEMAYPKHYEKFKEFVDAFHRSMWIKQFSPLRQSVIVHGDYRHSNLLIKYEDNKISSLIPVDYQTIYYGSPANDLIYFIFTGSDQQFRAKYYERLLGHYYKSLGNFLSLLKLDVNKLYPKEDFFADVKERLMYGFMISIFILPYILVEEKPDFQKKIQEQTVKHGRLFAERFNGIMDDCIKWGAL